MASIATIPKHLVFFISLPIFLSPQQSISFAVQINLMESIVLFRALVKDFNAEHRFQLKSERAVRAAPQMRTKIENKILKYSAQLCDQLPKRRERSVIVGRFLCLFCIVYSYSNQSDAWYVSQFQLLQCLGKSNTKLESRTDWTVLHRDTTIFRSLVCRKRNS